MENSASIILVLAIAVIGGLISSGLTKRLNGPQVLGYIIAGVLLGGQGINFIPIETVHSLTPLSFIALGIIGFLVGGEIELKELKKYAKKFSIILMFEGMLATLLVAIGSFVVVYWALDNATYAFVVAIVLGAISSATDPASTMGVIWEYRAAGMLTTTLTAIVALDDVLAMALYGVASNIAQNLGGESSSFGDSLIHFSRDIGGAILLGILVGYGLVVFLRKRGSSENNLFVAIGAILLSVGLAQLLECDLILTAMCAGFVATNLAPNLLKHLLLKIREMSVPIYILFFVLVGARLSLGGMPMWIWGVVIVYVIGRNGGKVIGSYWGAKVSKAEDKIAKYTGLGLFSQGGVAIGLAIVSGNHLQGIQLTETMTLGDAIIAIVTTTTFLIQLTGPAAVKWALQLAGETHKRLTPEDILDSKTAESLIEFSFSGGRNSSVEDLFKKFTEHPDLDLISVVDDNKEFMGVVSLSDLRPILLDKDLWPMIVIEDIVRSKVETISLSTSLNKAVKIMENLGIEQLCVVEDKIFKGYLFKQKIRSYLKSQVLV